MHKLTESPAVECLDIALANRERLSRNKGDRLYFNFNLYIIFESSCHLTVGLCIGIVVAYELLTVIVGMS